MSKLHDFYIMVGAIILGSLIFNGTKAFFEREALLSEIISKQTPVVEGMRVVASYIKDNKSYDCTTFVCKSYLCIIYI